MQSLLKAFLHSTSKTGQFITRKFHFMIVGQLRYVKYIFLHYTPVNFVLGVYNVFTLSVRPCVRPSMTLCFFSNILKTQ